MEIQPPAHEAPIGRLHNGDVIPLARTDTDATRRGGARRAVDAAQRRRRRPAAHDHAASVDTALNGRTAVTPRPARPAHDLHLRPRRAEGRDHPRHRRLDRLAATVREQESTLVDAVAPMPPALRILADDRQRLTTMLVAVGHLGDVAGACRSTPRRPTWSPTCATCSRRCSGLSEVGDVIPQTLEAILTYPTADSVEQEYFGDYGNLALTVDVSAKSLLKPSAGLAADRAGTSSRRPGHARPARCHRPSPGGRAGRHRRPAAGGAA